MVPFWCHGLKALLYSFYLAAGLCIAIDFACYVLSKQRGSCMAHTVLSTSFY